MSCCGPSGLNSYCPGHTAAMYVRRSAAQMQALDRIADWVDRMEQPPEAEPAKCRTLRRASARR